MRLLQPQAVQELAERASRDGSPVLSVYLNLDPTNPVNRRGGYKLALDGMLKELESQIKEESRLKQFQEDADWVRQKVEYLIPRGRSLVLFCDVSDAFYFEEDFPVRLANQVWYGSTPYVRLLREAMDEFERYGLVLVDREKARFFVITMGQIEEVSDVFQDPPFKHRSTSGSDQMRSQMVNQRRAAQWSEWFLKDASAILHDIMTKYGVDRIILAGSEEVTAEMSRLLPRAVASRLVDRVRMAVTARAGEVLQMAMPVIERIAREQERDLVNDLVTIARKSNPTVEKASLGVDAVMDAVNQGRVHRLIYASGLDLGGYHCAGCEVLLDQCPPDCRCPYCSSPLEEIEDLLWYVTEKVLNTGGRSEEIRDAEARAMLESHGGIGAFLR
jgi:peptide subunit release factor 1 (eRF1)